MNILAIQHVGFETPGQILKVAKDNKWPVEICMAGDLGQVKSGFDLLILMGGPMNIDEEERYPWLVPEKRFIKKTIQDNKPILGICLGAQLLAACLGAEVYPSGKKEIGWFQVRREPSLALPEFFPEILTPFHWHGDTFDLPKGALKLYTSSQTANQGFIFNQKVIGLQFHIEITLKGIDNLIHYGREEFKDKGNIMGEKDMLSGVQLYARDNYRLLDSLLNYISSLVE